MEIIPIENKNKFDCHVKVIDSNGIVHCSFRYTEPTEYLNLVIESKLKTIKNKLQQFIGAPNTTEIRQEMFSVIKEAIENATFK